MYAGGDGTVTGGGRTNGHANYWRVAAAVVAYGALACFLMLVGTQLVDWFRDGEWTHIGISDGLHGALSRCCATAGDSGRIARFVQWLEAPTDWLGLHKLLEVIPASVALFLVSVAGNWLLILASERVEETPQEAD